MASECSRRSLLATGLLAAVGAGSLISRSPLRAAATPKTAGSLAAPTATPLRAVLTDSVPPTVADMVDANYAFPKIDKTEYFGSSTFSFHYLSFVTVSGTIYGYYIYDESDGNASIGLATSSDGISWTDYGQVLANGPSGAWDERLSSFPGAYYLDATETFYLVYEGAGSSGAYPGDIGLATSADGITFTKVEDGTGGPILTHSGEGFESLNIGTPSLYYESGTWYLFYHGYDGTQCQLGVATGSSLTSLTKYSADPVFPAGAAGTWDNGTIGHRDIVKVGDNYYMVFEGSTAQDPTLGYAGSFWSSGLASAPSLTGPWTEYSQNPILTPITGFGNDGPSFLQLNGVQWIYYRNIVVPPGGGAEYSVTRRLQIANESSGGLGQSFDPTANDYHQLGGAVSGGWQSTPSGPPDDGYGNGGVGFATYGPYTTATVVDWCTAIIKVAIDSLSGASDVMTIDVSDNTANTVITSRTISRAQFMQADDYEFFIIPFQNVPSMEGHALEFRLYADGSGDTGNATLTEALYGTD